ncbi:hypothetical protein QF011_000242 [Curtobacterium flaccumfaciens]|nr:hypothetical protein [Curtobacterium flaccumfaciens]MDQ0537712.1 hypothetical protein [Curtobacterium flaccumfaciens]
MTEVNVTAIYELPVPIWVAAATLSRTYESGVGGLEFDVAMPKDHEPDGAPPAISDLSEEAEGLTWTQEYGAFIPESLKPATALVRIALLNVKGPNDDDLPWRTVDQQLAEGVDWWFGSVRSWVEVLTGQDLDPKHRVFDAEAVGSGLTFIEPPHQNALGLRITTPHIRPVQEREWEALLKAVGEGKEPPLEELLSRDARAAQRRGANRRAIIDATTAVEIALTRHVGSLRSTLPPKQQKRLDRKPSFGTFISIAEDSGLTLQVTYERLRSLNELRNNAAHRGLAPSDLEAVRAVQVMIDFLAEHGVYRRMATSEPDGSEFTVY